MAVLAREGQLRYVGGRDANVRGGLLLNVWPGCNCIQNLVMTNRDTDVKEHYQEFDMKLMNSLKTRLYEFNLLKKSDVTEHRLLLLSANKKNIHHRFNFLVNLNPDALRDTIWKKIGIQFCDIIGICINLEDATIVISWRTVNNTVSCHGTANPLRPSITKVRSDASHGFVDWIEFIT